VGGSRLGVYAMDSGAVEVVELFAVTVLGNFDGVEGGGGYVNVRVCARVVAVSCGTGVVSVSVWGRGSLDWVDDCLQGLAIGTLRGFGVISIPVVFAGSLESSRSEGFDGGAVRRHEKFVEGFYELCASVFIFLGRETAFVACDAVQEVTVFGVAKEHVKFGVFVESGSDVGNVCSELLEIKEQFPVFEHGGITLFWVCGDERGWLIMEGWM